MDSRLALEQWHWHLPGKWCAAEILEHLRLTYTATIKGFEKIIAAGKPLATMDALIAQCEQRFGTRVKLLDHPILGPLAAASRAEIMTDHTWTDVDRYATDLLVRPTDALRAAIESAEANGLPSISVTPPIGKFLKLLAQSIGARRILEIGTLAGYSTIWLAQAVAPDGRVVSLEVDPKHAGVARDNIARAGFSTVVDVRLGSAVDTLTAMIDQRITPFDLVFIDADKPSYADYLRLALSLSRIGTLIIADNVVRRGAVVDANTTDERVQGVRKFNDAVAQNPRLEATLVQTVGAKGYDGFTLARVVS